MNCGFASVLFLALVLSVTGQVPTPAPTPDSTATPQVTRARELGSSLKKYEQKESRNSPKLKAENVGGDETIRVDTDLFVNDVLVSDQSGNVVTGLQKEDFNVLEDGAPQTLDLFSRSDNSNVPRSIVLLLDEGPIIQLPYLKSSIESAKVLVDKLGPNDEMAVVTSTDLKIRADFTKDRSLLKKALNSIDLGGGTGPYIVYESLIAVLNEMYGAENRQRIVIVLGGGEMVIWLKDDKEAPYPVTRSTRWVTESTRPNSDWQKRVEARERRKIGFSEVKEAIEGSRATVYSVIPGIRFLGLSEKEKKARAKISWQNLRTYLGLKNNLLLADKRKFEEREAAIRTAGQAAMYRVAELSGGLAAMIEKPEDADRVFSAIFATIQSRYVIGHYVNDPNPNRRRRTISVQVRNHPEYTVTGRTTLIVR